MNKNLHLPIAVMVWLGGHIAVTILFIHTLFSNPPSFYKSFWMTPIMHFCWLEIAREYNRRNFS